MRTMHFGVKVARRDNQELINKFGIEIEQITNRHTTMGIEEFVLDRERRIGMKEGMEEVKNERNIFYTTNLLTLTDCSDEKIASLVGVDIEFVQKVKASLK